METDSKEKPPVWFPIAPIMVVVCITLVLQLSTTIVEYFNFNSKIEIPSFLRLLLGIPLVIIGLVFFIWGFSQLKPAAAIGFAKRLRTSGAYGLTRNPMYFGLNSAFWGTAILLDSLVVLIGAFIWSLLNVISVMLWEEKQMTGKFGQAYLEYKKQVPRFIPKIKWK